MASRDSLLLLLWLGFHPGNIMPRVWLKIKNKKIVLILAATFPNVSAAVIFFWVGCCKHFRLCFLNFFFFKSTLSSLE